jgi:NAD(P)-dependent dehydrogenase (short-subunit alcohol dehydrogenase family)
VNARQLFDLTGRVAIVTGGSIGLGRQMAEGLAEMGANLALCARKQERCKEAADELAGFGVKTLALGCDVKDPAAIQEVVASTLRNFGRIDILINNAGVSWGAPVEEMTLEQWNKVMDTNLTGTFLFSQAVGKAMIRQGNGKIINMASVAGLGGASSDLQAIGYHASKGGVIAFTKDLACKWAAHNVQVNATTWSPCWKRFLFTVLAATMTSKAQLFFWLLTPRPTLQAMSWSSTEARLPGRRTHEYSPHARSLPPLCGAAISKQDGSGLPRPEIYLRAVR